MSYDKLVDSGALNARLTALAGKLRAKGGTTAALDFYGGDFEDAVDALETGGCTVENKTASVGSNATSISFTGLNGAPKMFAVAADAQISLGSTRYVVSAISDGTHTYGTYGYRSSSSATVYYSTSYFSFTYANGTLTVKTSSSTNGGYFKSGTNYRLICAH